MPDQHLTINDPVYGFINVPRGLLCRVIAHPLFQRLERIRQLGMAPFVYPGAHHTRKQHVIGAFHLTQAALATLMQKGHFIFDSEAEATEAAILLHDVGHGPFSHVLEGELVKEISHEEISLLMMQAVNRDMQGDLSLALKVFTGEYPKPFLHELISSQLDMDRLDYLCRDSFYTGVREGNIGAARIVKTLDLVDERLVVDYKGIYSVENYLMARRLMYWQVYLHKTALAAEAMFRAILRRAHHLVSAGTPLFASPALHYFLSREVSREDFSGEDSEALRYYAALDDSDLICAVKVWAAHPDPVLSVLAADFTNRRLFKSTEVEADRRDEALDHYRSAIKQQLSLSEEDAAYFVDTQSLCNEMYSRAAEGIGILMPSGEVRDVSEVSNIIRRDGELPDGQKHYVIHRAIEGDNFL